MTTDTNKKRGRKKKDENIQVTIEESIKKPSIVPTPDKKENVEVELEIDADEEKQEKQEEQNTPIIKKRGRKPKGGKLINKNMVEAEKPAPSPNVILHLKCSLKDIPDLLNDPLAYNPSAPPDIMTYDDNKHHGFSFYEEADTSKHADMNTKPAYTESGNVCKKCNCSMKSNEPDVLEEDNISMKDINSKLKDLRIQFYKNTLNDKKSACFWCSYEFDNQACHIPKYEMDDTICGYGSFCRPECAVGYLMKENIDDSTKFERYQLLNQIYSKVYGYTKNIKPAPNPYYLLDKYYGNLTIQEYRKLLKTQHMLLVIDKPLTKILPELHDDNDEFILNIYGGVKSNASTGGVYKVKRQSEKTQGPTKNSIIKDKFGISN